MARHKGVRAVVARVTWVMFGAVIATACGESSEAGVAFSHEHEPGAPAVVPNRDAATDGIGPENDAAVDAEAGVADAEAGRTTSDAADEDVSVTDAGSDVTEQDADAEVPDGADATSDAESDAGDEDDAGPKPTISILDDSTAEGNAGTTTLDFTVQLSHTYPLDVTVDYATSDVTATVADGDYDAKQGTAVIPAGSLTTSIQIVGHGDTNEEPTETFHVTLSNPHGATILDGVANGNLVNDDTPALTITPVAQAEGNTGTSLMTFTVTLSHASTNTVTVKYATSDSTATQLGDSTIGGADYVSTNGTLTFAPGDTSRTIDVTINGDAAYEPAETFGVVLSNATNASIGVGYAVGTIQNDDTMPGISINDVSVAEGSSGLTHVSFTISLSAPAGVTVTTAFNEVDGTATGGVGGVTDYSPASGVLQFPPGVTSLPLAMTIYGDATKEPDETFFVNLFSATNATIADAQGVCTITNDD